MLELGDWKSKGLFCITLIVLGLFIFFPVFWMVSTSFKPSAEIFQVAPSVLPLQPTIMHYLKAFTQANIGTYLKNSLITAGCSSLVTTWLAAYAAYSLAIYGYKGRKTLMYCLLAGQMFPWAVILITIYPMMNAWHMTDTYYALILSYIIFALPAGIYILHGYFKRLPRELIESARVDGAGELRILHTIALPLSWPVLITVALYAFMWAWNDLLYAMTLTTSTHMRTLGPGLMLTYLGEFRDDWGGAMAASALSSLPIVVTFMSLQRYFIRGLTSGAVKG
jgi:multiple sugar transport system permease protein